MPLSVGEIVHDEITKDEGRIIRVVRVAQRLGYVVTIVNRPNGKEIEALWWPRELRELRERARKYRRAS